MAPAFAATDFLRYLALAFVWTLAGRAVLCALGLRALGATGWLLAPAIAQAFVALALGMSAVFRAPIHSVSNPLWTALLALAVAGAAFELVRAAPRNEDAWRPFTGTTLILGIALIVPAVVLLPNFVRGFGTYQATFFPDAWSYTVFGAYLWEYPRSTHGGLAPAYQWAAVLSGTRFVAASELGWLATVTREGDTQAAFGLLLALNTFIVGSTCAAVGRVLGLPSWLLLLTAVAGGAGNWIGNVIVISNLDNLLALSYLPALATLGLDKTPTALHGRAMAVALVAAGAIYTYPEFAAVSLCCGSLYFLDASYKRPIRWWLIRFVMPALIAGILVAPYVAESLLFLRSQLALGVSAARPGEGAFAGLIEPARWPAALWATGAEDVAKPLSWPTTAIAGALSALAIVGLLKLLRSRVFAPLATLVILAGGFSIFVWHYEYSYGAYKFVILGWWLAVVALAIGVRECSAFHPVVTALAAVLATATFSVSVSRSVSAASAPPQPEMSTLRAVSGVEYIAQGRPVAIAVADDIAAHWATYFLRRAKTRLVSYSGYLAAPHVQPALAEAEPVPWSTLRLLLTDAVDRGPFVEQQQHWTPLWGNQQYTLWDTGDIGWAIVWNTDNGYPTAVGPDFVWIGDKPVTIRAAANAAGIARVRADLGLSQPLPLGTGPFRILVADGGGATCEWSLRLGGYSLLFGLRAGENVLTLTKTSPLGIKVLPEADQRHPFMVALWKPTLEFSRGVVDASAYCPGPTNH